MVSEGEVTKGVVKWLIEIQQKLDQTKQNIILGFWVNKQNSKMLSDLFNSNEDFETIKESLAEEFEIEKNFLDSHFLGVLDFTIPWDYNHTLIPDLIVHMYYVSQAYSEIWAIECKGDDAESIRRGFQQVIIQGRAFSKSIIALASEKKDLVKDLKNLSYGILTYDSENEAIEEKYGDLNIQTKADPELLNYNLKYLRDLHLKKGIMFAEIEEPFMQSRIATKNKLSIALHIFYNQNNYNRQNGLEMAKTFSQKLGMGQEGEGISSINEHIKDLKNIQLIDNNYNIPEKAKSFFYILDSLLEGTSNFDKIADFREKLPSVQSNRVLYEGNKFGFIVANLIKMYLLSYKEIQEWGGWIEQASREAAVDKPTFAHVVSVALKQDPLLASKLLCVKRTANQAQPSFQFNKARSKPNQCAVCEFEDKVEFCFCGESGDSMFITDYDINASYSDQEIENFRNPFQERYNEFFEKWKNCLPMQFFTDRELRTNYIKTYVYDNGNEVEILAPCFIKCIVNTNINKTTGLLKHAGLFGKDVRSGLKAELCPRYDLLYINPNMEVEEISILDEENLEIDGEE